MKRLTATLTALLLLAPFARAVDEIELVSGKIIKVDRVLSETFREVRYRKDRAEASKPADQVKEVRHDISGKVLDDYSEAVDLMNQGEYGMAIEYFSYVLEDDRITKPGSRYAWAVQHALIRAIRCQRSLGDSISVIESADRLLTDVPETFFYAQALHFKAQALVARGKVDQAATVYRSLADDVQARGLPDRWGRESALQLLLLDRSLTGAPLRSKLQRVVEDNRERYPTVANRANVAIGDSMLADGDPDGAERFFAEIVRDGTGSDETMARAYSGLGDCFYHRGNSSDDREAASDLYKTGLLHYLRVAVVYKDESQLVPRALFHAAMCFDRVQESDARRRARQLVTRLKNSYPRSVWTQRAEEEIR